MGADIAAVDETTIGPMVPSVYTVVGRTPETADTVTLELAAAGAGLPAPEPGQFNMLWAPGIGEVPISSAGTENGRLVHTIRAVGAVTTALCSLQPGDQLGVRGPFGRGWGLDRAAGRDVLIVAGGLGLVPLRPVIHHILDQRDRYDRVAVLVGARAPKAVVYADEMAAWAGSVEVAVTVDVASSGWRGHVGAVTGLLAGASTRPGRDLVFVCGPEIMMRVVATAVAERGTPDDDIEVSLERNMHCGFGHCGRCQLGPVLLCRNGPVVSWTAATPLLAVGGR